MSANYDEIHIDAKLIRELETLAQLFEAYNAPITSTRNTRAHVQDLVSQVGKVVKAMRGVEPEE